MTTFIVTQNEEADNFISAIQENMKELGGKQISSLYQYKIIAILIGTTLGIGLCWASISRFFPSKLSKSKLSHFIHHSFIPWSLLHRAALLHVFKNFISQWISIIVDDSDLPRCKITKRIFGVFKTIDKATGGFINAQNIVVICAVCKGLTIPLFFKFYQSDPRVKKRKKEIKKAKKEGVSKKLLPKKILRNKKKYPTKQEIFISLLKRTVTLLESFSKIIGTEIKIRNIIADGGFVSGKVLREVKKIVPEAQFVGRMKNNQMVLCNKNGKYKSVNEFFEKYPMKIKKMLNLRGKEVEVEYKNARLFVKSFGKKVHVIALRYSDDKDFRYIFSSDMTYRAEDIIRIFSLRWLIEVAFQDMKRFIGSGQTACQQGKDGAAKVVLLNMLVDMFLLTHSRQIAQLRAGQPLYTVGAMRSFIQLDCLKTSIEDRVLNQPNPNQALEALFKEISDSMDFAISKKHITDDDFPDVEPSPSLEKCFGKAYM